MHYRQWITAPTERALILRREHGIEDILTRFHKVGQDAWDAASYIRALISDYTVDVVVAA